MITDNLRNAKLYLSVNKGFEQGFAFIEKYLVQEMPDGRYEVDGDRVYALVQSYETTPESMKKWEAHKNYIDLQYVAKGNEIIYSTDVKTLKACTEYDKEKDLTLFEGPQGTGILLSDGYFTVLFPDDAHKPGCEWGEKQTIKKLVVKVKV